MGRQECPPHLGFRTNIPRPSSLSPRGIHVGRARVLDRAQRSRHALPRLGGSWRTPSFPVPRSCIVLCFWSFVRVLRAFRGRVSWASRPQTEKRRHPRVPPLRAALTRPSKLCDADHSVSPSTGARSPAGRRGISGCRGEARWGKWEPGRPVDRVGLIPGMCQTTDAVACARRTDVS